MLLLLSPWGMGVEVLRFIYSLLYFGLNIKKTTVSWGFAVKDRFYGASV